MGSSVILPAQGQPSTGPDPSFSTAKYTNVVTFGFDKVGPPSPLYVQRDDVLLLEAASSAVDTVIFNIRMLYPPFKQGGQPDTAPRGESPGQVVFQGIIEPGSELIQLPVGTPNNLVSITRPLSEGYLLAVTAISGSQRSRGITFARAMLVRGSSAFTSSNAFTMLFSDYATNNQPCGWPYGRVVYPTEGPGAILRASISNPSAGVDFLFQPVDALRWRIQSLTASLATSATVANRIVHALVSDIVGNNYWNEPAITPQAASTTVVYSFGPGLTPQPTVDGVSVIGLPSGLIIAQRHRILTSTTNLQAGDQWSNIQLGMEQWEDLI